MKLRTSRNHRKAVRTVDQLCSISRFSEVSLSSTFDLLIFYWQRLLQPPLPFLLATLEPSTPGSQTSMHINRSWMLVKSADSDFIPGDFDRVNVGSCLKTSILVNVVGETDIHSQWIHALRNILNNQVMTLVPTSPNFRFSKKPSDNIGFSHDFTKKRHCLCPYVYSSPCENCHSK